MIVLGWDVGGSNTKVSRVVDGEVAFAASRPFELRHAPHRLVDVLRELCVEAAGDAAVDSHAVTMTAELSRNFSTKREGVAFVCAALTAALPPPAPIHLFTVDGTFVPVGGPFDPLLVASANWMATARLMARTHPDAIVIDVGSTTTDIVPITGGRVASTGRTDPERLASGELLYTGALRTPVEGLAHDVAIGDATFTIAAEGFATSGDVYRWLGELASHELPHDPGERLRRALCADRETLSDADVEAFARALADAQVSRIAGAIGRVRARHPSIARAVIVGLGGFIAERAARRAGLAIAASFDGRDAMASRCAPAAAVALLFEDAVAFPAARPPAGGLELVVKIGGGLMAHPDALRCVLREVEQVRGLIVPGGGPFADAVRRADADFAVGDDAAHWMAILAMDQYAELLVTRLVRGARVETLDEAVAARRSGRVPVLAPSRWLRDADPLPHTWEVTSDSLAAWIAGQAGARRLVVIKPPGAAGEMVDASFERACPASLEARVVPADQIATLRDALRV